MKCLNEIKTSLQEAEDCLYSGKEKSVESSTIAELEITLAHCLMLIEKVIEESK